VKNNILRLSALIALLLASFFVRGQQYNAVRPATQAVALQKAPEIDGEVQNDPVWQALTPFDGMTQLQPNSGRPATEKTDIRIGYTATTFYLSVVCHDAQPDALVVSDARRDAPLDNTDAFLFILDTYHDKQNGFIFGTNPVGVEYDAQVDNEGQGNFGNARQQGGVIGGFNLNWDASWTVRARTDTFGWCAEFAIPLRTLRFATGKDVVWGVNFQRNIRKTNEIDYWAPLPIQFDLKRLSLAGDLRGLSLQSPGNLKLIPYVLGRVARDYTKTPSETKFTPEIGGDVKLSLTPAMTLDLTYNTDFAQVEVDDQQVNLDRFNLFFPEKRPFFLENAGFFSVGAPGEVDLFFSRRIGISDKGNIVPIIGGARVSGRAGRTNVGLLNMFTDAVEESDITRNNFTVARLSRQIGQRSSFGGIFVNRMGLSEPGDDYNRVFAADGKWGIGKKAQLSGFYAKSASPGQGDNEHAFKLQSQYEWNGWNLNAAYSEVGQGFNPEVGFLQRTNFRKPEILILKSIRPNGKFGLLELRPHTSWRGFWDFDGKLITSFLHIDNHWEFVRGMEFHTGINFTTEGVVAPFQIARGITVPVGSYHHKEAQLVFWTNPSKPVYINIRSVLGGFFGGTRQANTIALGVRFGDRFNSEFSLNRNDVQLPAGDFNTNIVRARLSYSFTPRLFLQGLIQYNSLSDTWSTNLRFSWLQQANSGLFVVFNNTNGAGDPLNRSFIVKYSRVFDVLK
jgi:Domain of unknown function (DUF5916)